MDQGSYTGDGSTPPVPTWDGPDDWTYPHNLVRSSQNIEIIGYADFVEDVETPDGSVGAHYVRPGSAPSGNTSYVIIDFNNVDLGVPTVIGDSDFAGSVIARTSLDLTIPRAIFGLRRTGSTPITTFSTEANVWKYITANHASVVSTTNQFLRAIFYIAGGDASFPIGSTFDVGQWRIVQRPDEAFDINEVPYRPHPSNWYEHGMYWTCTNTGTIDGHSFAPGDRLYAVGNQDADYLVTPQVAWSDTPLGAYLGSTPIIGAYAGSTAVRSMAT